MVLDEIDANETFAEVKPILGNIIHKFESGLIDKDTALAELKSILNDVNIKARLSSTSQKDVYEWQGIIIAISNVITDIETL